MLNLNLNTLSSKLTEQPRGVFTGLISASFVLYGGGGGGSTNNGGGGGGGAGMVVSGALQIVPNVTYNVIVGSGASASLFNSSSNNPNKAETSWMYGSNIVSANPFTASAGGGFCAGTGSAGPSGTWAYRTGGASGAGFVYLSPSVSSSYPSYAGGAVNLTSGLSGGGAGSGQNGYPGDIGVGGSGSLIISSSFQTYGYYSSSVVVSPYSGSDGTIGYALGAAGGGAGARLTFSTEPAGGFFGGGTQIPLAAFGSNGYGPGAGGAGLGYGGAPAGNGGDGKAYIIYCGAPKMDVTNATTIYDTRLNTTVHIFNKGTGSFNFNFEKYGSIPGCQ